MNAHQRRVWLRSKWDMRAIKALPRFTFDMESDFFTGGVYRPLNDFFIVGQQSNDQEEVRVKVLKARDSVPVSVAFDFTRLEALIAENIEQWSVPGLYTNGTVRGIDCHRQKAAEMFNVAYDDVTQEQRAAGKNANYLDYWKKP